MPLTDLRATAGGRAFRPASVVLGLGAAGIAAGLVAVLIGAHLTAGAVVADGVTRGGILVQADHVDPGATFTLTGADLDEAADIRIELVRPDTRAELGTATTATDGTLTLELVVPATFPTGYAEVVVLATGASWSTTILIGDRAEGPAGASVQATDDWLPLILALAGAALLAFALFRFVRAGQRSTEAG